jgi:regulatory protein
LEAGGEGAARRRALEHAARALAKRDRTEAEIRAALERRSTNAAVIESVVAELIADGYLDDARYARRFAEDRRTLDRWGSERIARNLEGRGVARELIEAALADREAGDELAAARELLAERFPGPLEGDRQRDRAWRTLVRRGYTPELAYDAVREHSRSAA